jgi:hypothetical protein
MIHAGAALLVLSVILLLIRRSQQSKLLEIGTTETSTAQELLDATKYVAERLGETGSFSRIVELKGMVKCDSPLISEIARQSCVYYEMKVTREYEEDHWETHGRGARTRGTRRRSEQVAGNSQRIPFWLEDATGRILVDPDRADIDSVKVVDRFEPAGNLGGRNVLTFGGFRFDVGIPLSGSRTLGYHFEERLLPLDRRVYVLGEARDVSGQLTVAKPLKKGKSFIISLKSEEDLIRSTGSRIRWLLVGAVAGGVAGVGLILAGLTR